MTQNVEQGVFNALSGRIKFSREICNRTFCFVAVVLQLHRVTQLVLINGLHELFLGVGEASFIFTNASLASAAKSLTVTSGTCTDIFT